MKNESHAVADFLKSRISSPMAEKYSAEAVERGWDHWWNSKGFYKPFRKDISKDKLECFTMIIPPPNVTGKLHIGHALTCTIQDSLVRWNRMSGRRTLWVPGTDHAGIATQNVVERSLKKNENVTRFDLGRDRFLEKVWQWKEKHGDEICAQIRRLGCSVDWNREFFTMQKSLSYAVNEAFVRMYKKGRIYRAKRFVNWSCTLSTAIADCEVIKEEVPKRTLLEVPGHKRKVEFGVIHKFSYKFEDSEEEIMIETTRPETMLGDVAVAVHPLDYRYKHLIGRFVKHPFVERRMEIVADEKLVDMEKGTGVVKITPSHDENDFLCGERHSLGHIEVFGKDGKILIEPYSGMARFDCRFKIIEDLKKIGQYYGKRNFQQVVCRCSRSNDIIEPLITSQWWVNCEDVAKKAIEAVRNGELTIQPKREEKIFFGFLEKIRPWCVSRQLWWGHRIPAFFPKLHSKTLDREIGSNWIVETDRENAMRKAKEIYGSDLQEIEQDEDVLDTWFSSALLPFSVFGWPNKTEDLEAFFPNSILETGSDILFFWVARMVFMSLELTDKLPFKKILLHPIVRAADGSKMSKSKGNIVDPLEVIDGVSLQELIKHLESSSLSDKQIKIYTKQKQKEFPKGIPACGADALRFGLLCHINTGDSINLDVNRVRGYRMFCNKIWQTANFAFPKLEEFKEEINPKSALNGEEDPLSAISLSLADKWILNKVTETEHAVSKSFEKFDLAAAATAAYNFWLKELCDVYLELIKPAFFSDLKNNEEVVAHIKVLFIVLHRTLRLFHPFMPFISEELFQRLPGSGDQNDSISVSEYPLPQTHFSFPDTNGMMETALNVIKVIRSAKSAYGLNGKIPRVVIKTEKSNKILLEMKEAVKALGRVEKVEITQKKENSEEFRQLVKGCSNEIVDADISVHIELLHVLDFASQLTRMEKKRAAIAKSLAALKAKMSNPKQREKTPQSVKDEQKKKCEEKSLELEKIKTSIEQLSKVEKETNSKTRK